MSYYVKCDGETEGGDPDLWYVMDDIGPLEEASSREEAEAIMQLYIKGEQDSC